MKTPRGFAGRVAHYVDGETDAMINTPRWADTSYPIEISDLIKSASKANIGKESSIGDLFHELSDITGESMHKIIDKSGKNFVIQTSQGSNESIQVERDHDGRLVVGYNGKTYHEFDRTGNVYSHSMLLAADVEKYGYTNITEGLMSPGEVQYDIWRALTHDALSETEISDMESVRKTPTWRAYEEQTERRMIAKHFSDDQEFVQWLLGYGKKSPFKTADRVQATLDVFHMMCHLDSEKRNYANGLGTSYEVALDGLARLTDPETVVHFSQVSRHPLQIKALLQQIQDQGVVYFPGFLTIMRERKGEIINQIRYTKQQHTHAQISQGIDIIEKNMNIINNFIEKT